MLRKSFFLPLVIILTVVTVLLAGWYFSNKNVGKSTNLPSSLPTNTAFKQTEGGSTDIIVSAGTSLDTPYYSIIFPYPITLVSISTIPGTQITEHVWGFQLNGREYRFKTQSAVCYINPGNPVGEGLDRLQVGEKYSPAFIGFEKPISGTQYLEMLNSDQNAGCKTVRGGLRGDPDDRSRLIDFFTRGNSEGLGENEGGILDLTEIISAYETGEK